MTFRALLTLSLVLGCGLMAGVFFAFSSFVMPALARLPPAAGIAAMQSINVAAISRLFMTALFGTAAGCVLLAVLQLRALDEPGARLRIGGALLYVLGAIVVTAVANVPRNEALAVLQPELAGAAGVWTRYVSEWTAWNHVRGACSLAAAALLTVGLLRSPSSVGAERADAPARLAAVALDQ
jgi:uncharacterized membrane protein